MNFKRILAGILCVSMLAGNVIAYSVGDVNSPDNVIDVVNGNDEDSAQNEQEQEKDNTEDTASEESGEAQPEVTVTPQIPAYMRPSDYYYNLFTQILRLYVDKHLYEASEIEVLMKMVEKLIEQNPYYFKYLLNTMLSTLDPYSAYHEVSENFLMVEGASTGFGVTIDNSSKGTMIQTVLEDSPAQKAGLLPGDEIISVCGYGMEYLPKTAVMTVLSQVEFFAPKAEESASEEKTEAEQQGENQATVAPTYEIIIERNGEKHTFNIAKGPITQKQISHKILEDKETAVITILSFLGNELDVEFNALIKNLADSGIKNLTIDLRNNGGGSLDFALSMAETFVDKGELMCHFNSREVEEPQPIYSSTEKISFRSITILVNEYTASASELFTNILHNKGLAKVIGKTTVGKTMGQAVYNLVNGDTITITTYEMLDENKQPYDINGIKPDLEIDNVELLYRFPESLNIFNHQNYVEIKEGVYSDVAKGLEDRLAMMGLIYEDDADGVFDKRTSDALRIFQRSYNIEVTGVCTHDTVTKITEVINRYKSYTYYEDSQYDVALIVHSSFSQGKRLVREKKELAEDEQELIKQREEQLLKEFDEQAEQNQNKAS